MKNVARQNKKLFFYYLKIEIWNGKKRVRPEVIFLLSDEAPNKNLLNICNKKQSKLLVAFEIKKPRRKTNYSLR